MHVVLLLCPPTLFLRPLTPCPLLPSLAQSVTQSTERTHSFPSPAFTNVNTDTQQSVDPPTLTPIFDVVQQCINKSLTRLQSKSFYLGNAEVRERLAWYRHDNGSILIDRTSVPSKKADSAGGTEDSPSYSTAITPALLSTIMLITWDDFWMYSDGNWQGPSVAVKTFADVKLSCTGGHPPINSLSEDFSTTIDSLDYFMSRAANPSFAKQSIRVNSATRMTPKLRFRHTLFSKLETRSSGKGVDISACGSGSMDPIPTIWNWPTNSEIAAEKLKDIQNTHRVNALSAYDIKGNLIYPSDYVSKLKGALVEMRFTFSHWTIARKKFTPMDSFVANINSIRVLDEPKLFLSSPRKRKVVSRDPFDAIDDDFVPSSPKRNRYED